MKALVLVLLIPATAIAADNNGRGTKAIGLGNAFVAVADNPWAVAYNVAGLAQCKMFQASAFYVPQQFGLPELRTTALSASFGIKPGTIGILIERFGFDLYNTSTFEFGYGFFAGPTIAVGATVGVDRVSIARYGAATGTTLDLGCMGWPTPELTLGFVLRNVTASTIGSTRERLPQNVLFGVSYTPIGGFQIVTELEKDLQFPVIIKAGVEQNFLNLLSLRCGISNHPDKFTAGFAVRYEGIVFGYAGYSHPDLGWTHQIDLTVRVDGPQ